MTSPGPDRLESSVTFVGSDHGRASDIVLALVDQTCAVNDVPADIIEALEVPVDVIMGAVQSLHPSRVTVTATEHIVSILVHTEPLDHSLRAVDLLGSDTDIVAAFFEVCIDADRGTIAFVGVQDPT